MKRLRALQEAPSFACSVASLSRSPGLQLPGSHSLHCGILADYLLGWGRPSTCSTGLAEFQSTSSPSPHRATGDWVLPAKGWQRSHFRINPETAEIDKKRTCHTHGWLSCVIGWPSPPCDWHTFSAFWLWSSVVSVLISVTTDMSPTGDLLVTLIFLWGGVLSSLLRGPRVLHWHGTKPGAAHPLG